MLIKYLKNAPNAFEGDVKDIPDAQAKVLILTSYAKEHKPRTKSAKSDDKTDPLADQKHTTNSE